MGTRVDVVGWGGDGMGIVDALVGLVARHEAMWSVFRPTSEVSRLNAAARTSAPYVKVSAATDRLLADAVALSRATGGAFNPLVGPLVALWDVKGFERAVASGREPPPAPSGQRIAAVLALVRSSVLRRSPDAPAWALIADEADAGGLAPSVDLGAIAKGRTADEARDLAVSMGAKGVLVSVGTSSVAAAGTRPDSTPWRIGVRDPGGPAAQWTRSFPLPCPAAAGEGAPVAAGAPAGQRGAGAFSAAEDVWSGGRTSYAGGARGGGVPGAGGVCGGGVPGAGTGPLLGSLSTSGDNLGALPVIAGVLRETTRETEWARDGSQAHPLIRNHIIDPRNGQPAALIRRQVSVVAASGVLAEALSTALMVAPDDCIDEAAVAAWAHGRGIEGAWRIM